jgi:hypothetical protein
MDNLFKVRVFINLFNDIKDLREKISSETDENRKYMITCIYSIRIIVYENVMNTPDGIEFLNLWIKNGNTL